MANRKYKVKQPITGKKQKAAPRVYADDPIFFHKGQLRVGVTMHSIGRRDPTASWEIKRIVSFGKSGKPVASLTVNKLSDVLYMRNKATGAERALTFGTMSYSAIWQLPRREQHNDGKPE